MSTEGAPIHWIQNDHDSMRQEIEMLDRYLYHLQYEGKQNTPGNLQRIRDFLPIMQNDMARRMQYEEKILFPFLTVHIPRLSPLFHLLQADHEQCRHTFRSLIKSLKLASTADVLQDGYFLTSLLHSHWSIEDRTAIGPLEHELKNHEKKRFNRLWGAYHGELPVLP